VWAVPTGSDLVPGSLLFTSEAQFVGLVIIQGDERAIVPSTTLLAEADRLLARTPGPAGTLGLDVQALTPTVAAATGASQGVVVTWVDAAGPADGHVRIGDVIEAIDGHPVATRQQWDVRMARLSSGETVGLRGRSRGGILETALAAVHPATQAAAPLTRSLGLTLRARARRGSEVIGIQPGSAGARAGLEIGDLITLVGDVALPTPRQLTRAFGSMPEGQPLLVGVTRGSAHLVTALER
jgi:S1-C subfamily serine protease